MRFGVARKADFLLWMFWHNVLALFILRRADAWQREVMAVLSAIEAFLGVMLLGIYFGDFQLGPRSVHVVPRGPQQLGPALDCARRLPHVISTVC